MAERETLQRLTRQRLVLLAMYGAAVIAFGAAILLLLVDLRYAVAVVDAATLFYLLVVRRADHQYNLAFAQANLRFGSAKGLQEVEVRAKDRQALRYPQVAEEGLIPARPSGGVVSSLSMRAKANQESILVCEAAICYNLNRTKHKVALHNGVWIRLDLGQTTHSRVVMIPTAVMDGGICPAFYQEQGLHSLDAAPKGWAVFTDDDLAAARLVRKSEAIRRKAEQSAAHLMLSVRKDHICGFLTPRSLSFRTPLLGKLTPGILEWDLLPELSWMMDLARAWDRPAHKTEDEPRIQNQTAAG